MPVAKLGGVSTPEIMKSDEGNDSLDTIRQAIGREPLLSYSRTGDSPVHWIQFLQAFDQQGWPLLSPQKVQMQKCDKCSREFCSPINYRRHIRVHRRSLNVDKESHKDRDLLGVFWDKLSLEEAKEIVSFTDVTLEETTGSSIIRALMSLIRQPGLSALPQAYVRAGSALLDIIQARPSRLPIDSQELFSILDDASERTFLCAGTAKSVQKYVFDGEAGKIGLETKNVVACTSFLVEQKLVKAWLADKDAEALRCQKLLVEEEEAAQKRQAEILERKRQKRLRQKEQRAKEPSEEKTDLKEVTSDTFENPSSSSSPDVFESNSDIIDSPTDHVLSLLESEEADIEAQLGFNGEHSDSGTFPNVEHRIVQRSGRQHLAHARWQVPKLQRGGKNIHHASQSLQVLKLEPSQKHGSIKVWTRKPKPGNDGDTLRTRLHEEAINQTDQSRKCEVMIGSIPVTFENSDGRQQGNSLSDSSPFGVNRSLGKLWRPVSRHETSGPMPVQSGSREFELDVVIEKGDDRTMPDESCLRDCATDENDSEIVNNYHPFFSEIVEPEGLVFSSQAAKAFLSQRWKEAIAAEHVKLVLPLLSEPPGRPKRSTLGNAENQIAIVEAHNFSTQTKPEKNIKIKYIPKYRTFA